MSGTRELGGLDELGGLAGLEVKGGSSVLERNGGLGELGEKRGLEGKDVMADMNMSSECESGERSLGWVEGRGRGSRAGNAVRWFRCVWKIRPYSIGSSPFIGDHCACC